MNDILITLYIEQRVNVGEQLEQARSVQRRKTWGKRGRYQNGRRLKGRRRRTPDARRADSSDESFHSESDLDWEFQRSPSTSPTGSLLSLEASPPPESTVSAMAVSSDESNSKLQRKGARRMKQLLSSDSTNPQPLSVSCSELNNLAATSRLDIRRTLTEGELVFKHNRMAVFASSNSPIKV